MNLPPKDDPCDGVFIERLLKVVQDPMMVILPDRTVVAANEALLSSVGQSRDEVIGRRCHEVSHRSSTPCTGPGHGCPLERVLAGESSGHALHEHFSDGGESRFYDVMSYPVKNGEGEIEVVVEIWRDISSILEKQVQEKTVKIKEDLARLVHEDKMISLGKLVASAVHEVNNPLAAIHTFSRVMLRMLREGGGELSRGDMQEMEKYLDLVSTESKRCGNIIGNLLSFSRQPPMVMRPVDLSEVTEKIVQMLRHKLDLSQITLETSLEQNIPCIIGHLNQVQQCIMNLIFNAAEAMPEGGELSIRTSFDRKANTVGVDVRDSGCGIPEGERSRVFEPFFSTKPNQKGVGLGLAVVYGIISEHRGTIDFESRPGEGTTFRIRFPVCDQASLAGG